MFSVLLTSLLHASQVRGQVPPSSENRTEAGDRMERLLNVFTIVKFPNDACNSTGGNYYGTCYTATECTALGNIINIVSLFLKVQNVVTHYVTV